MEQERQEKTGCGCWSVLSTLFGIVVTIMVIVNCFKSCGVEEKPEPQRSESEAQVDVVPDLSPEAKVMEHLYFHTPYTELGTVEIIDFEKRDDVLEYMALLGTDKSVLETARSLAFENKLFGEGFYYTTGVNTQHLYVGGLKDNKPHGFGAIVGLADGSGTYEFAEEFLFYYVGNFKNGMKHGFGVEFFADECDITAAAQNVAETGLVTEEDGERLVHYLFNHVSYEGYWKENEWDGRGNSFEFPTMEGMIYFNEAWNLPIEGYIYGIAYPDINTGTFKKSKPHGKIKAYINNCLRYEGELNMGVSEGEGTQYYTNGQIEYEGEWKNGEAHGFGSHYNSDGTLIYSGQWDNGDYAH